MIRAQLTTVDEMIATGTWRIVVPRQVMKKFFGTDREYMCHISNDFNSFIDCMQKGRFCFPERFVPALTDDEKAMLHNIAVGPRKIDMHLNLEEAR